MGDADEASRILQGAWRCWPRVRKVEGREMIGRWPGVLTPDHPSADYSAAAFLLDLSMV